MSFEENPLLLVAVIVLTVEGWNLVKAAVQFGLQRRRARPER
jgi:hypothetical protein